MELRESILIDGGWTVANMTRRALTHMNLANRAQALYEAEKLSANRPDNKYCVYHQTNGRLELDCIIVNSAQLPIFEVVEL